MALPQNDGAAAPPCLTPVPGLWELREGGAAAAAGGRPKKLEVAVTKAGRLHGHGADQHGAFELAGALGADGSGKVDLRLTYVAGAGPATLQEVAGSWLSPDGIQYTILPKEGLIVGPRGRWPLAADGGRLCAEVPGDGPQTAVPDGLGRLVWPTLKGQGEVWIRLQGNVDPNLRVEYRENPGGGFCVPFFSGERTTVTGVPVSKKGDSQRCSVRGLSVQLKPDGSPVLTVSFNSVGILAAGPPGDPAEAKLVFDGFPLQVLAASYRGGISSDGAHSLEGEISFAVPEDRSAAVRPKLWPQSFVRFTWGEDYSEALLSLGQEGSGATASSALESRAFACVVQPGGNQVVGTVGVPFSMNLLCPEGGVHMVQSIVMNPNLLEKLAGMELRSFDSNKDGVLSLPEFVALARKLSVDYGFPALPDQDVCAAFRRFDYDGSGGMNQTEFTACFRWLLLRVCPLSMKKGAFIQERQHGRKVWDEYTKGKRLGSGYFGECFRAVENGTGRDVVVKKFREEYSESIEEFEVTRDLDHPNVVRVFEVFVGKPLYIVAEFAAGGDLYNYIQENLGNIAERCAAGIMRQVLSALGYCHGIGVLHHDIKPDNILITSKEPENETGAPHIVVGDWGQATKLQDQGVSEENFCYGDDRYYPPEMHDRQAGVKSDLFMCGVTMVELLTGKLRNKPPHAGECSDVARELLTSMLERDYDARATVRQCLAHRWFTEGAALGRLPASELAEVVARLRKHAERNTFQKLARNIFAARLGSQRLQRARRLFERLDVDGSGTLSRSELRAAFGSSGEDDAAVRKVFAQLACSDHEDLDFNAWVAATMDLDEMDEKEVVGMLHHIFIQADTDGRGQLTLEELFAGMLQDFEESERAVVAESVRALVGGDGNPITLNLWGRCFGVDDLEGKVGLKPSRLHRLARRFVCGKGEEDAATAAATAVPAPPVQPQPGSVVGRSPVNVPRMPAAAIPAHPGASPPGQKARPLLSYTSPVRQPSGLHPAALAGGCSPPGAASPKGLVQVVCPSGATPGSAIPVRLADSRQVMVKVPMGVLPGQAFRVQV